ncbi:hypothetical protein L1987_11128 [Smallanthus sonchifolius]|uniref:Uncharacterized protein n=2 Tax=Smallanthus sonchifolius TaxID=185202 RepID=A0ACB9JCB5_9ASTR|nr:hypothetical protein L1987_11126 [Smallanthus sonchifolius]KAI3817338.1 hypothetical protein L1987_11128 [Smallanthus sonchifolius]
MKKVMEQLQKALDNQLVMEPSEVRLQTRSYGEALAMHELSNSNKTIESWREALVKASDLSQCHAGWDVTNGNELEYIQKMVGRISNELLGLMQHSEASAETSANTDLIGKSKNFKEAIEFFSRRAFGKSEPSQGFEKVSQNIVSKFGGHPSALIRLGSFLHGKRHE